MFLKLLRMGQWAVFTVLLFVLAIAVQAYAPGTMLAVSLYKAHLLALGGWGAYWLDRALFPYDRPHEYLEAPEEPPAFDFGDVVEVSGDCYGHVLIRRAIVVAAALICVGLGGLSMRPRSTAWWDNRPAKTKPFLPTRYTSQLRAPVHGAAKVVLWLFAALVLFALSCAFLPAFAQSIPADAHRHRATLKREAQRVWGLNAPVATFAAQIHQESRWREDARSVVGAQGLAQFMPATATWIGGLYPSLADRAPMNPTWAIRGLVTYDKWLIDRIQARDDCQAMAFALSAYNGGLGWVYKRQKRSDQPGVCLGATCTINPGVTPASQRENEHYPRVILLQHQPLYASWGPGVCR